MKQQPSSLLLLLGLATYSSLLLKDSLAELASSLLAVTTLLAVTVAALFQDLMETRATPPCRDWGGSVSSCF